MKRDAWIAGIPLEYRQSVCGHFVDLEEPAFSLASFARGQRKCVECIASQCPARPAKLGDTISVRGLCPL